ncbi:MAG: ATP-dependent DNA helicase DinG [Treponema sp.]|nr:ATP-dependent DNA helicase DinG [Treponema sp.]MCL2252071.1 ATP-dependent DNA helicase DinG [Treponema sp.]
MTKLNAGHIIAALQEEGSIANRLPSYEPRQSQLDLLDLIIRAFNEDALCMAEAGTGVGKSFAYLLPAMHFALANKEKVVISTATITLQQQLYEKDIPLVASAIGEKVKAVLMKGRGNYLCLRRLEDVLNEPPLVDDEYDEVKKINEWAQKNTTGCKSDLSFLPSDFVWSSICSESDLCLGIHCPYKEQCFILALRKTAQSADIIVVNHHLLFADLAARYQGAGYENSVVLPPFNRLIIDEAHTIENAATSFFSAEFGRTGIVKQLGKLYHRRRGNNRGLLIRLISLLPSSADPLDEMADAIEKIRTRAEELDNCALEICGMDGLFRLSPAADESFLKKNLFPYFKSLNKEIKKLTNMIRDLTENFDEEQANDPCVYEIKTIIKRLEGITEICEVFCKYKKHEDDILWMEKHRSSNNSNNWAVFTRTPLDLAPILKDSVFAPNKTVVCVSATLALNDDFSFWASNCGIDSLPKRKVLSGCFPSPFPYSSAVLLAAPKDAPLPDENGYQEFVDKAATDLASVAGGSALVLFTSYQSLTSAFAAAKNELNAQGIRCLKQGDDDRTRLLQDFLSDTKSCLFATDSFWEGVDAPGDTLRLVIICRLPFRTPGDPVFEARREAVQKRGGNPFMELSLPQAVMKFKQGFGRLMRRSADRGVVAVLDGRLLKKTYGQLFLQALPSTKTSFDNFNNNINDVENFLY